MTYVLRIAAVTALAFGAAAPLFADTMADPATMTCKDLMAMDKDGMMAAGTAIHTAMMSDAMMAAMSDEDTMKAAETACTAHADATVMDAMKMK